MSNFWETLTLEQDISPQKEEFLKKYKNCILSMQRDKLSAPQLVTFVGLDDDNYYVFISVDGLNYKVKHKTDVFLSASFPSPKLINYNDRVYYFCRIPARQYRKAPNRENCVFIDVVAEGLRVYPCGVYSLPAIIEAFTPTYPSLHQAIAQLRSGSTVAIAVNEKFAISLHPSDNDVFLLWMETTPVAEFNGSTITVKVEYFHQEIVDFVNRNRHQFTVE